MVWDLIKDNLDFIIPIFLPISFICINLFLKLVLREVNFDALGSDTCLGGCSLFIGTMLAQIHFKKLSDSGDIITGIMFAGFFIVLWWACLSLSYKEFPVKRGHAKQPLISAILGSVSFYVCSVYTWQILK